MADEPLQAGDRVEILPGERPLGQPAAPLYDLRENTPPVEPPPLTLTPATALGNNVVLRLADGRYALYAHLHTGSVRVHVGLRPQSEALVP